MLMLTTLMIAQVHLPALMKLNMMPQLALLTFEMIEVLVAQVLLFLSLLISLEQLPLISQLPEATTPLLSTMAQQAPRAVEEYLW